MPRLPGISQKQAVRVFQKLGHRVVRDSGHLIMSSTITMAAIARDAGLTPEQFRQMLWPMAIRWQQEREFPAGWLQGMALAV